LISGHNGELNKLQSEFCKVFTHPTRLLIIHLISDQEMSVKDLVAATGLRQSNVSQHLSILRTNRIIDERRNGNFVYYKLTNPKIIEACNLIREILASQYAKDAKSISSVLRV
jgi:ArsR family transcriptional regulator